MPGVSAAVKVAVDELMLSSSGSNGDKNSLFFSIAGVVGSESGAATTIISGCSWSTSRLRGRGGGAEFRLGLFLAGSVGGGNDFRFGTFIGSVRLGIGGGIFGGA